MAAPNSKSDSVDSERKGVALWLSLFYIFNPRSELVSAPPACSALCHLSHENKTGPSVIDGLHSDDVDISLQLIEWIGWPVVIGERAAFR